MAEKSTTAAETHTALRRTELPHGGGISSRGPTGTLHSRLAPAAGTPNPAGKGGSESVPPPGSTDQSPGAAWGAPRSWFSGDCTISGSFGTPDGHGKSLPTRCRRKEGSIPHPSPADVPAGVQEKCCCWAVSAGCCPYADMK